MMFWNIKNSFHNENLWVIIITICYSVLSWLGDKMQEWTIWLAGLIAALGGAVMRGLDSKIGKIDNRVSVLESQLAANTATSLANHELLVYVRDKVDAISEKAHHP